MDWANLNDWELIGERNEHEAFATLFDRHHEYVFRVARGLTGDAHLAEDITQDVFIRTFQKRRKWKPKAAFRTLLYGLTLNVTREHLRKRKRDQVKTEAWHQDPTTDPAAINQAPGPSLPVTPLLEALPARQREVVVLRFFERCSVRETAAIMGCREGTVKAHLHKAIHHMRRQLKGTK